MTACALSTFGFQPAIVPSSVAKRKKAGPETPSFEITKSVDVGSSVLKAWPVGAPTAPAPAEAGAGIATTRGCGLPAPSYSVVTPAWLSETQMGVPGPTDVPHGFLRLGSVCAASPGMSETRFACRYERVTIPPPPAEAGRALAENAVAAKIAATAPRATIERRLFTSFRSFSAVARCGGRSWRRCARA